MKWLITLVGAGTVGIILRDVFHTLWHPTRHGGLSRFVMTVLWRLSSRLSTRRRQAGLAGPLGMVTVVAMWASGVTLGWALIYWPHLPDAFSYATGLEPTEHAGFVDAVYVSLVTLATLGLGDIAPTAGWLRIAGPLEALVGFALLTATVSWILGIYPALARRRALALKISHIRTTDPTSDQLDSGSGAILLAGLATEVGRIGVDLLQYAESYYFHDGQDTTSLAVHAEYATELAQRGCAAHRADVHLAANILTAALDDLAAVLEQRFLHTAGTTREIFQAYARDHGGVPGT
ncbi:potassium channel family protein [Actinacidiphila sp. bgisy160]|uniref:potassium channel family protein n=1 Tax=Actinacidiphila sp. bgisy160 TaxID=3413796 RepID=UPI003D71E0CB